MGGRRLLRKGNGTGAAGVFGEATAGPVLRGGGTLAVRHEERAALLRAWPARETGCRSDGRGGQRPKTYGDRGFTLYSEVRDRIVPGRR